MNYTVGDEYIDDDDYVCFRQTLADGREIFWTLHHDGWNAFRDWEYEFDPFYRTGRFAFPDESELNAAASEADGGEA